ncbi:MAG: hypothetical protein ACE5IY_11340 [bacterium]
MRDSSGTKLLILAIGLFSLISCRKSDSITINALPQEIGSELYFRGFVTDEEEQLVSEIHNFSKKVTRRDTVDGKPVFVYTVGSGNAADRTKESYFYTDEDGTVWEHNTTDVGAQLVAYGFSYRNPILLPAWQTLLKVDEGEGTEWQIDIDTTYSAITLSGETQTVRYVKHGRARYEGWSETFLPEPYKYIPALDVYWYELRTTIINETTSDTLFATEGIAHQYFTPELGAVKYVTNFTLYEQGKEAVARRGTWELMRKELSE